MSTQKPKGPPLTEGLPTHDRGKLIYRLRCFSGTGQQPELLADWILEVERRLDALEGGKPLEELT